MSQLINDFLAKTIGPQGIETAPIIQGLKQCNDDIFFDFDAGVPVHELVHRKSVLIDQILCFCFEYYIKPGKDSTCSLVAVGGYGRCELLPGSDIYVMI